MCVCVCVCDASPAAALLKERDINDDIKWVIKYGGSIPELR